MSVCQDHPAVNLVVPPTRIAGSAHPASRSNPSRSAVRLEDAVYASGTEPVRGMALMGR